jgi:hypothetical protein
MSDAQRARWARNLRGRVTRSGFLRLRATGRLRLARAGRHAGPQLAFGGAGGPFTLIPGRCRRTSHHDHRMYGRWVSWNPPFGDWCLSPSMRAQARGSRADMRALIRGVRIR